MNREGVVRGNDGKYYIPESRRPDGTIRPAIRVKEGYIPPEEQKIYRAPGSRLKEKPKINLFEYLVPPIKSDECVKEKKKPKKKPVVSDKKLNQKPDVESKPEKVETDDPIHRIRVERKRLKQICEIEAKKLNGDVLNKDQIAKLLRKNEVESLINNLENALKL